MNVVAKMRASELPEPVRSAMHVAPDQRFAVAPQDDGTFILVPEHDDSWLDTPDWQARIEAGLKDLAEGRSTVYYSADELLAGLDGD